MVCVGVGCESLWFFSFKVSQKLSETFFSPPVACFDLETAEFVFPINANNVLDLLEQTVTRVTAHAVTCKQINLIWYLCNIILSNLFVIPCGLAVNVSEWLQASVNTSHIHLYQRWTEKLVTSHGS